ncbi:MAG: hypothetical protein KDA44_20820 [Planctomycetales bacterium]|nr:hypothetical protein [Planctomycetales bacterium]
MIRSITLGLAAAGLLFGVGAVGTASSAQARAKQYACTCVDDCGVTQCTVKTMRRGQARRAARRGECCVEIDPCCTPCCTPCCDPCPPVCCVKVEPCCIPCCPPCCDPCPPPCCN